MRTTINLPDDVFTQAKQLAVATGRTFTAVVEDALREVLARRHAPSASPVVVLPTAPGAPRPGVDLDDSAAVLDLMERDDPV